MLFLALSLFSHENRNRQILLKCRCLLYHNPACSSQLSSAWTRGVALSLWRESMCHQSWDRLRMGFLNLVGLSPSWNIAHLCHHTTLSGYLWQKIITISSGTYTSTIGPIVSVCIVCKTQGKVTLGCCYHRIGFLQLLLIDKEWWCKCKMT